MCGWWPAVFAAQRTILTLAGEKLAASIYADCQSVIHNCRPVKISTVIERSCWEVLCLENVILRHRQTVVYIQDFDKEASIYSLPLLFLLSSFFMSFFSSL